MQRRALAVQCCTYLKQQALAVERLARCKRRRRRNLHPAGNIKYFSVEGGYAVLCCLQCFAAPT